MNSGKNLKKGLIGKMRGWGGGLLEGEGCSRKRKKLFQELTFFSVIDKFCKQKILIINLYLIYPHCNSQF